MFSHHQNSIVELSIKELILSSLTLILHINRLWSEVVNTMLWHFSFNAE